MIFQKTVTLIQQVVGYTKTTDGGMYVDIRSGYNYPCPTALKTLAEDGETLVDTQRFILIADKTVYLTANDVKEFEKVSVAPDQTLGEAISQALGSLMILKGEILQ